MDRLAAMRVFAAVVDTGSFSGAARQLRCGNSTVTEAVMKLERHLGVQLLNRTTRKLALTWEGEQYYRRVRQLLSEVDDLELSIGDTRAIPRGRLAVDVPAALGRAYIVPALPRFSAAHPLLEIELSLDPRPGSHVGAKVDLSIQFGEPQDGDLVAKKIYETRHVACAAPEYLAAQGEPQHPGELRKLNCLGFFSSPREPPLIWRFAKGGEVCDHEPAGTIALNSSEALIEVATRGAGVIYMPDILVRSAMAAGSLRPLLRDWDTLRRPLYLVRPRERYVSAKVRTFGRFVEDIFDAIARADRKKLRATG